MKIKIFISTFGKKVLHVSNGIPIEVGANKRNNFLYSLKDNTGDNISDENDYFGELTGLYWIWKNENIKPNDIIGFCHYNKSLSISDRKIKKFFKINYNNRPWVALPASHIRNHDDKIVDEAFLQVLKRDYPDYYKTWFKFFDEKMQGKGCRSANMFITTGSEFKKYCTFLFGVCFKARRLLNDYKIADKNMRRYCAFAGERLLAVYLYTNNCNILDTRIKYKKWYLPLIRRFIKYFKINRDGFLYKKIKRRLGYKSSYGRE